MINYGDAWWDFGALRSVIRSDLKLRGETIDSGRWQSQDIVDPNYRTIELQHVALELPIADMVNAWQNQIKPNLPWAEEHFLERVSGQPLNPPPSHVNWPFAKHDNTDHMDGEKFSHTYPERMWPKFAMVGETRPNGREVFVPHNGIRYEYGDLGSVVELLRREPLTRQAFLPIWFPEDTGVVHGERVPCTLGYHFMIRGNNLDITYYIRSCDFFRHFSDDVYMAGRLAQWMVAQIDDDPEEGWLMPRNLIMYIESLHCFEGDRHMLGKAK